MKTETIGHAMNVSFVVCGLFVEPYNLTEKSAEAKETSREKEEESLNQFLNSETGMNFNEGNDFDSSHVRYSC